MKSILIFISCIVLGFFIVFFTFSKKATTDIARPKEAKELPISQFSVENPPSNSLHGDITLLSGATKWQSRTATEASVITQKRSIQQGETLLTGDTGNVSVAFPDMLFTLTENSTLNFIQTLPSNVVLEQKEGNITYENTSSNPLAIRVYPMLIEQIQSTAKISIDDDLGTTTIKITTGSATVAYNDSDNISTVEKITAGHTMTFDTSTRTSVIK
ncbi:hypothetical protein BH09PAT1_BH09PAT1_4640 [soil metagenome]